ncbi:uncharacterized protein LOC141587230 [Silene latifolia]|uniref:uncharacterized protein LOC141587230 n=1 Tax=Silene latifolia TaxID=37657 RepID=UPI003D77E01A
METQNGDSSQEGRRKRQTLLEVLEQCLKTLESLSAFNDYDDDNDQKTGNREENRPGSSCRNSVVEEGNQLSTRGAAEFSDSGKGLAVVFKCDICEIKCSNLHKLEQHKSGKRHKKKEQYLEKAIKDEQELADTSRVVGCETCQIQCPNLQSLKQHISGKNHKKKVASS